jgi:hypothetical protein
MLAQLIASDPNADAALTLLSYAKLQVDIRVLGDTPCA